MAFNYSYSWLVISLIAILGLTHAKCYNLTLNLPTKQKPPFLKALDSKNRQEVSAGVWAFICWNANNSTRDSKKRLESAWILNT